MSKILGGEKRVKNNSDEKRVLKKLDENTYTRMMLLTMAIIQLCK
jgi:hypothetical protein